MKCLWFCVTLSSAGRGVERGSQKQDRKAPDPAGPSCGREGICRAGQNPVPPAHNALDPLEQGPSEWHQIAQTALVDGAGEPPKRSPASVRLEEKAGRAAWFPLLGSHHQLTLLGASSPPALLASHGWAEETLLELRRC